MHDLPAIVAFNASAILLLCIVLLSSCHGVRRELPDDKLYFLMVVSAIVQAVLYTISYFVDGRVPPAMYGGYLALCILLFVNNTGFALLWGLYVEYKLFGNLQRSQKKHWLIALPALLVVLGSVLNVFTPVFFVIDPETLVYTRTPLYWFPVVATYIYMVYGLVLSLSHRDKNHNSVFFPVFIFMIPILLGTAVEYFFYGLNVLWLCVAISLTSVYITLQNKVTYTDALSGLFTRLYMLNYLQTVTKRMPQNKTLVGIMLDIDRFKAINDTYGHLMGDDAIRSAANILRAAMPSNGLAFRFAGDEFVVLLLVREEAEAQQTVARIRQATERFNAKQGDAYHISFSAGWTAFDCANDTLDHFLGRMDATMYLEKKGKSL